MLGLLLLVLWCFGAAFNTSTEGPFSATKNGYFATWCGQARPTKQSCREEETAAVPCGGGDVRGEKNENSITRWAAAPLLLFACIFPLSASPVVCGILALLSRSQPLGFIPLCSPFWCRDQDCILGVCRVCGAGTAHGLQAASHQARHCAHGPTCPPLYISS